MITEKGVDGVTRRKMSEREEMEFHVFCCSVEEGKENGKDCLSQTQLASSEEIPSHLVGDCMGGHHQGSP